MPKDSKDFGYIGPLNFTRSILGFSFIPPNSFELLDFIFYVHYYQVFLNYRGSKIPSQKLFKGCQINLRVTRGMMAFYNDFWRELCLNIQAHRQCVYNILQCEICICIYLLNLFGSGRRRKKVM